MKILHSALGNWVTFCWWQASWPERYVAMANSKVTLCLLTWPKLVMSRLPCWGWPHPGRESLTPQVVGLSRFLQHPGLGQGFQLLSFPIQAWHFLPLCTPGAWWLSTDAAPLPHPRGALASVTVNPLHHLGLIRAQWRMISLHIKALEQLYKLAPSQSSPFSPPGAGLELPGSACWGWAASSEGLQPLAAVATLKALCCSEVESAAFSPNRAPRHTHCGFSLQACP